MFHDVVLKQKLQKEQMLQIPYIPRTKHSFAQKWIHSNLIKVVLGPRRAGKSVFSVTLLKNMPFMYFNFDDEVITSVGGISTHELIKELHTVYGKVKIVLFDEIQNLPHWELFVNRLHREGYNVILTGSNAQLLSQELATALTGRHIPIEILPFNFQEFLRAKKYILDPQHNSVPEKRAELLQLTEEYGIKGGFPEIVVHNLDAHEYLNILYDSLLFKDVVKRHKVRFSNEIGNLGSYLLNNFASSYSLRKLQNILHLKSVTTTEKYTKYLEESYLLFSLLRYSPKSIQRIKSPKKIYAVDNGFIHAKAIQHSPDKGKLMENLVFTELMKRGFHPNKEIFYYKTRNDREIDFVIKKELKIIELLQVCYNTTEPDGRQRETKALLEAADELHGEKLTILTWDEKSLIKKDGLKIQFMPLYEWLLDTSQKMSI